MTKKEYHDWAKNYVAKFGINDAPGLEMVAAWYDDLVRYGATIADLIHVASRINPAKREQHRGALVGGVVALLAERKAQQSFERRKQDAAAAMPAEEVSKLLRSHGWIGKRKPARSR